MPNTETKRLAKNSEIQEAFPILQELRSNLDREELKALYKQMQEEGYQLFGRYVNDDLVAVAGVTIMTNFYLGRHAFVFDLVTTADHRSEGHGKRLLNHIHDWARNQGCTAIELESGLWREDAHRFYLDTMGYEKYCYSFRYDLE